jgi:tRNA dimethylallyltransferase
MSINRDNWLITIIGPTATGKSTLAVTLARRLDGEVISADSRQVYRGFDIGSGKVTKREMRGIPHHLIDIASPRRTFTVAHYQKTALKTIHAIWKRGHIPILCGGTGLYVRSVIDGIVIPDVPPNPSLRKTLSKKTTQELYTLLMKRDPLRARDIDRNNPRRLIRALEIVATNGTVPPLRTHPLNARILFIGVDFPDVVLKKRIATRLRARIKSGMIAEVKKLHASGLSWKKLESFGLEYGAIARLLQKKVTRKICIENLERDIWRYAKRQRTWFKRDTRIHWISTQREALALIRQCIEL